MLNVQILVPQINALFTAWEKPDTPGGVLGIIHQGELIYKRGYGLANLEHDIANRPTTAFDIASVSKQFTSFCVLVLAERGLLKLDDDLHLYFPQFPDYGDRVTLRHLLHHTSGLRDYIDLMVLAGMSFDNHYSEAEIIALLARQRGLNFKPGSAFSYSNSGHFLLGEVVCLVSGKSLRDFADETIFKPLGMHNTTFYDDHHQIVKRRAWSYWGDADSGFSQALGVFDLVGDGGVLTTVEDLYLWDQNFYRSKLEGGAQLIEQLQTPGTLDDGTPINYAAGLFVSHYRGQRVVEHAGEWMAYLSMIKRFPDQRFSVILLMNRADESVDLLAQKVVDLCLENVLSAPEQPLAVSAEEPTWIDVSDAALKVHEGRYLAEEIGLVWTLTAHEGKLRLVSSGGLRCDFVPQVRGQFRAVDAPYPIKLTFMDSGKMLVERAGQTDVIFEAVSLPEKVRVSVYTGTYFSPEVNAVALVEETVDGLQIRFGQYNKPTAMTVIAPDLFNAPTCMVRFTHEEGGKDARVNGFLVNTGQIKRIRYERR